MEKISFDYSNASDFINEEKLCKLQGKVTECHHMLHNGNGLGSEYLGWVDLPNNYDKEEFQRIKIAA